MLSGGSFCDWFSWKNLVIIIAIWLVLTVVSMPICTEYMADLIRSEPDLKFVFYSMKGCGYCVPVRPIWQRLQKRFAKNKNFVLKHYDTETNPAEIVNANIRGFPTIRAIRNNQVIATFSGNRTEQEIASWIMRLSN